MSALGPTAPAEGAAELPSVKKQTPESSPVPAPQKQAAGFPRAPTAPPKAAQAETRAESQPNGAGRVVRGRAWQTRKAAGLPVSQVQWTPAQERALAKVIRLDSERRVWVGSLEITELVRPAFAAGDFFCAPPGGRARARGARRRARGYELPLPGVSSPLAAHVRPKEGLLAQYQC